VIEESPSEQVPTLTLFPEYGVFVPVWSPGIGPLDADGLAALGVSGPLIERLHAWNKGWQIRAHGNRDLAEFALGEPLSVQLARELQAELPDYEIFLTLGPDPRPVKEWPA
jgi:hypothetical protein